MSYLRSFFIVILLFLLASCGDYISFELPEHEKKIFVESYITENDSMIVVILQKTLDPFLDTDGILRDSLFRVDGAKVSVTSGNETILLDQMGSGNSNYTMGRGTAYYKKVRIKEQQQYLLNIEYKGLKLNALTSFPAKTKIRNPIVKYNYSGGNHIFDTHVELSSDDGSIKHYRMYVLFDIILNNHKYGNRTLYYYFNLNSSEKILDLKHVLRNGWVSYSGEQSQRPGKATIVLERISDLYFNFKESVEVQEDDNDTVLGSEVTEIPSNINGGYGIFTGITRDTVCVNISN